MGNFEKVKPFSYHKNLVSCTFFSYVSNKFIPTYVFSYLQFYVFYMSFVFHMCTYLQFCYTNQSFSYQLIIENYSSFRMILRNA
jgi:hypothetical protein